MADTNTVFEKQWDSMAGAIFITEVVFTLVLLSNKILRIFTQITTKGIQNLDESHKI